MVKKTVAFIHLVEIETDELEHVGTTAKRAFPLEQVKPHVVLVMRDQDQVQTFLQSIDDINKSTFARE